MSSIEILGGLYMKPSMKIDRYETEKSHIANDMKFITG